MKKTSDEKTNVNKLVKVVLKDIFFTKCCIFTFIFKVFFDTHGRGSKMLRGNLSGLQSRGVFRALPDISEGTF